MDRDGLTEQAKGRLAALLGDARPQRDVVDAPEPGAGRRLQRRHVAVVGVLLAVACALAGWSVLAARATVVAIPSVTAVTGPSSSLPPALPAGAPTATPSLAPAVVVHVAGAVVRPGLVTLPDGSRVADALEAAGGARADADLGELNLAERLVDGSRIRVGTSAGAESEIRAPGGAEAATSGSASGAAPATGSSAAKLDLNKATAAQLEQLPGIGPVTAQKIVDWRTQHQRFSRVEELQEVDGIGAKTYARLAELVRV